MDIVPVDTTGILSSVTEKHSLIAFQLFVIIALIACIRVLYNRLVKQGEDNMKALIDSTLAINNSTTALNALTREIERSNDAK